jgi:hypothetical protein
VNISRQMLFIIVLLVWHYTTTCAGVGKTVAGEGRTGLGHSYQLNQSTVSAGFWTTQFFYAFIMRLTVEERVFILENYLKTMSYSHCTQSFFKKIYLSNSARPKAIEDEYYSSRRRSKWKNAKKSCEKHGETCR